LVQIIPALTAREKIYRVNDLVIDRALRKLSKDKACGVDLL
jgi:hypothetical protein